MHYQDIVGGETSMTLNHIDQKDSLIHTNFFEIKFSKILLTIR